MTAAEYYWRWLGRAFSWTWATTDTLSTAIGIFLPAVVAVTGATESMLNLVWQIPLCLFCALLLMRFVVAPWLLHTEQEAAYKAEIVATRSALEVTHKGESQELLVQLEAIRRERDAIAVERDRYRAQQEAKPATVGQVLDVLSRLARESKEAAKDPTHGEQWLARALECIKQVLAERHHGPFERQVKATTPVKERIDGFVVLLQNMQNYLSEKDIRGNLTSDQVNALT